MAAVCMQVLFNYGNDEGCFDSRSAAKGPEPEGLDVCEFGDQRLLFLTLERADLVAVFDISKPKAPEFVEFLRAPGDGPNVPSRRWMRPEGVTCGSVKVKSANPPRRSTKLNLVFTAWEQAPLTSPSRGGGVTCHLVPRRK